MPPHVTILLPVYNAAPFLADALQSLLDQTYPHLSILILDDGSTDASPQILADTLHRHRATRLAVDRRSTPVQVLRQPNAGAVTTLNRLIALALAPSAPRADFLALMHADDISLPTRIEQQVAYLTANPALAIAGTWIESFLTPPNSQPPIPNSQFPNTSSQIENQKSKIENPPIPRQWHYPSDPRFTAPSLLFWCCFAHPTMMFRHHVLEGTPSTPPLRYDPAFPMPCEDYALWARASQSFHMGNVPEVLLRYRLHPNQASAARRAQTQQLTQFIRRSLLARLGIVPSPAEITLHQQLADQLPPNPAHNFLPSVGTWLQRLLHANSQTPIYDPEAFAKILAGRWAAAALHSAAHHLSQTWPQFWSHPLAPYVDRTLDKNRPIPNPQPAGN